MSDKETVFSRYAPPPPKLTIIDGGKADQALEGKYGKQSYQAFRVDTADQRTTRIRIEHGDLYGTTSSLARSYLTEWIMSQDRYLTLLFTTAMFRIEGGNLGILLQKLDEDQVNTISCFNAARHVEPDKSQPVITRIERVGFEEQEET